MKVPICELNLVGHPESPYLCESMLHYKYQLPRQGGIKHCTSPELMLSDKNLAGNCGCQMRQKSKNSGNSTLNKLNLLYESLYERLDFCFFLLFKQFLPLDKSIFWILNIKRSFGFGHTISTGNDFFFPGK